MVAESGHVLGNDNVSPAQSGGYQCSPIGREGIGTVQVGQLDGNTAHKSIFTAVMGGRPMTGGPSIENMDAAQVLWDEGMADTPLEYVVRQPQQKDAIFVVVADLSHRPSKERGRTDEGPAKVARGLADFVYITQAGSAATK